METVNNYPGKRSTQATSVVSETQRLLSKLGHGYKRAKAQQILRLLKDQESLNQRFRDCALDDDENDDDDNGGNGSDGQDSLAGNVGDAPPFIQEKSPTTRKSNANEVPKRLTSNVDPGRCRTSMGFYNEAECSGSMDGNEDNDISDFEAETDAAILEEHEAMLGRLPGGNKFVNSKSRRLFRLQLDDTEAIPEEGTIQSARSSRPKTGIVSNSARNKQYRRPSQNDPSMRNKQSSTISTSVSKLEGSVTPRGGIRGFCDNTQDGGLQLTPRFNDMGGSFTPRVDDLSQCFTPRAYDAVVHSKRQYNDIPGYLTPRQNDAISSLTPRQSEACRHTEMATTPRGSNQHRAVLNFYSSQLTPREDFSQYVATPRFDEHTGMAMPRTYHSVMQARGIEQKISESASQPHHEISKSKRQNVNSYTKNSSTLATSIRIPHTPRSMLSVDQSPIHVIPAYQDGEVTPRRPKNESKSKIRTDMQRTGGHQNLSKMTERVHPINVMKLPPLEVTINKPVIS